MRSSRRRWRVLIGVLGVALAGVVVAQLAQRGPSAARGSLQQVAAVGSEASVGPTWPPACQAARGRYSSARLDQVSDAVRQVTGQQGGLADGAVEVSLPAGRVSTARSLVARFGDAVHPSVGGYPYCHRLVAMSCPVALLPPGPARRGLRLDLQLTRRRVRAGGTLDGNLVISWHGQGTYRLMTGQPATALVLRPGSLRLAGLFTGGVAGAGSTVALRPGQSTTIPVLLGTTRCGTPFGTALPPGPYVARVELIAEPGPAHQDPPAATETFTVTGKPRLRRSSR